MGSKMLEMLESIVFLTISNISNTKF